MKISTEKNLIPEIPKIFIKSDCDAIIARPDQIQAMLIAFFLYLIATGESKFLDSVGKNKIITNKLANTKIPAKAVRYSATGDSV